jgi:hypothetical protein
MFFDLKMHGLTYAGRHKSHTAQQYQMHLSYTEFHPNNKINTDGNLIPLRVTLRECSGNSKLQNKFLWTSPALNFTYLPPN